ncbi:MAG: hypothetical protein MI725_15410, partial [Pirellulales bacterium]|nr:hypothetical protein [Pirellulales bacterium]
RSSPLIVSNTLSFVQQNPRRQGLDQACLGSEFHLSVRISVIRTVLVDHGPLTVVSWLTDEPFSWNAPRGADRKRAAARATSQRGETIQ